MNKVMVQLTNEEIDEIHAALREMRKGLGVANWVARNKKHEDLTVHERLHIARWRLVRDLEDMFKTL